jgi:ketosteroid isomerase-like protein
MKRARFALGLLILVSAVAVLNCRVSATAGRTSDSKGSDIAKDVESLRATDLAWSEAAARKDLDGVVAFMTDDGETLAPNEPAAAGKAAVKAGWESLLNLPDLKIQWEPTRVEVANSSEIGYTRGTWTMSFTGPDGKPVSDHGKYLEVWKKIDGKWKCSSDMYSSDVPAK